MAEDLSSHISTAEQNHRDVVKSLVSPVYIFCSLLSDVICIMYSSSLALACGTEQS
jgi:hypothetical protein